MRIKAITSWGLALLALSAQATQAQNLEDLVQRLVRQTDNLAQRSYDSFSGRRNASRNDIEALYQARSLNASAELFQRMVRDRRSDSELRDAFTVLQDLLRGSARYAFDRRYWSDIQRTSDDLARELNLGRGDRDDDRPPRNDPDGRTSGRLRWRGTVDGESQLLVRRSDVESRTLSSQPATPRSILLRRCLEELWMFGWRRIKEEATSKLSNSLHETTISRWWFRFGTKRAERATTSSN